MYGRIPVDGERADLDENRIDVWKCDSECHPKPPVAAKLLGA